VDRGHLDQSAECDFDLSDCGSLMVVREIAVPIPH
jgi:hypothetical protein